MDYLRDPEEIYRRSWAMVHAEADLAALPPDLADVAARLVHACGMTDIVADLAWRGDVAARAPNHARAAVSMEAILLLVSNDQCAGCADIPIKLAVSIVKM